MNSYKILIKIVVFVLFSITELYSQWSSFAPGLYWNDIDGNRIEAHGGGFIKIDSTYFWIGEDKSHNEHLFKGVNCYSSTDLMNWKFRNAIITKDTHQDLNSDLRVIERPKVIYNDSTKQFVLWLHYESSDYSVAEAGVFICSTIDGDYELVRHFRPSNNMSRDCNLFKDDDGTAYFVSAANNNADLVIYKLTPDYLNIENQIITLWKGQYREAPAMVKKEGIYYLISSGATGWDPNQAKYGTATSIEGPWTGLQNFANENTYDSQPTYIIPIYGTIDTSYIYCGDRWQDPDLVSSKYVWFPISIENGSITMTELSSWQVNLQEGTISDSEGSLPSIPTGLKVESKSYKRINLEWIDNSNNEAGFEINRKQNNDEWQVVGKVGINVITYEDMELDAGQEYYYKINSFNGAGKSDFSSEINDTTISLPSDSLIGYWKLNENNGDVCYDSSVFDNVGHLINSPNWSDGINENALEFDGSSSYVEFENSDVFDVTDQISILAWVKQYDAGNGEHNPWITKGDHTFALKHQENNNYEFFIYDDGWHVVRTPVLISHKNEWHHFAGTYNGHMLKIFVDGKLQNTAIYDGKINVRTNDKLNFARNSEETSRFFNGKLDEVMIFNTALNDSVINNIYSQTVTDINKAENTVENNRKFKLYNNYPNPFNPTTKISFRLPRKGKVKIAIYDITGAKVKTLLNNFKTPGTYSLEWNGTDKNGNNAPSGIYIYRITVVDYNLLWNDAKKMILLK